MDLTSLVPYAVGAVVGSIATGLFTTVKDHYGRKQQFRLDVIKNRIEYFGGLSNEYLMIASSLSAFREGESNDISDTEKFYFMCKFFYYYSKIAEENGGFEFHYRMAEEIATKLVSDIFKSFGNFDYEIFSNMIDYVTGENNKVIRFNKFEVRIEDRALKEFQDKILKERLNLKNLLRYCRWLEEILMFEINTGFRYYYGEEPNFELYDRFINYLIEHKAEDYIHRLKSSNKNRIFKYFQLRGNYY